MAEYQGLRPRLSELIEMECAILNGKTFEEAGLLDDPEYRAAYASIKADIERHPSAVIEVPFLD